MQEIAVATNNSRSSYIHSILTTKKTGNLWKFSVLNVCQMKEKNTRFFLKRNNENYAAQNRDQLQKKNVEIGGIYSLATYFLLISTRPSWKSSLKKGAQAF